MLEGCHYGALCPPDQDHNAACCPWLAEALSGCHSTQSAMPRAGPPIMHLRSIVIQTCVQKMHCLAFRPRSGHTLSGSIHM